MAYKLGKKISDEGVWSDFNGAKFLIGRAGSIEFLKAQEQLERPYKQKIARDKLSSKIKRDLNIRALARAILIDWKGVENEKGDTVAYTEDLGFEALSQDPDLLEFVVDFSIDNENFAVKQEEKIAKKSTKQ